MTTPQYLNLYLDHAKVGCGWRAYVLIRVGRKWARLVCTETAETLSIEVKELRGARPLPFKRTRLARRLRQVARDYGQEQSAGVRQAIAMLKAAA